MEDLPPLIQALIVQKAELPIDTFLHYRRAFGVVPKKLRINPRIREILDKLYAKRSSYWAGKKKLEGESNRQLSCPLAWHVANFDREKSIEIMIDEDWKTNTVKFAFRARKTTYEDKQWPELWTVRKIVCDLQSGEQTDDWTGDSDDDDDDWW